MRQLLEYEAKRLAQDVGLTVPRGLLIDSHEEAEAAAKELGDEVMIKAQVPLKGRQRRGAVVRTNSSQSALVAAGLLGAEVGGYPIRHLLIEEVVPAKHSMYVGIAVSEADRSGALLVSKQGGAGIESRQEDLVTVPFSMTVGLRSWHIWEACSRAGIGVDVTRTLLQEVSTTYTLFDRLAASVVEINPLFISDTGQAVVVDLRVISATTPSEYSYPDKSSQMKMKFGFDFLELNSAGHVGLVTTGAGSSMLLVDMLTERGVLVANFCDIRAGTIQTDDPTRIEVALAQLSKYGELRCIAVNVFAGVTDLVRFAGLLRDVVSRSNIQIPIVARLEGRGAEKAKRLLSDTGIRLVSSFGELVDTVTFVSVTDRSHVER